MDTTARNDRLLHIIGTMPMATRDRLTAKLATAMLALLICSTTERTAMSPALAAKLPPTATNVTDFHDDYDPEDPFAAIANAADEQLVEALVTDTVGDDPVEFGIDFDCDPMYDLRGFFGL